MHRGDTTSNAVFYINDADLGVTQSGTSTWTLATSGSPNGAVASAALNLQNGTIGTTAVNTSNMTFALGDSDFVAGTTPLVQGSLYAQLGTANVSVTGYNNTAGTMTTGGVTLTSSAALVAYYDFTAADVYALSLIHI